MPASGGSDWIDDVEEGVDDVDEVSEVGDANDAYIVITTGLSPLTLSANKPAPFSLHEQSEKTVSENIALFDIEETWTAPPQPLDAIHIENED